MANDKASALAEFSKWYESLAVTKQAGGPARGTIASALVVLERLRDVCDLDLSSQRTQGGSQIRGVSATAVARILARYRETREFLKEGGRTNRGAPGSIGAMLRALASVKVDEMTPSQRVDVIDEMQRFLVGKVGEFHARQRLKVVFDPGSATVHIFEGLLKSARQTNREGPVAQYLVGAKLQLRFPDIPIRNQSYSTADVQGGQPGDFRVGDTAFHVTVAPLSGLYDKCQSNLRDGLRVFVLVPDRIVPAVRGNATQALTGAFVVQSVEYFVAQNLEELGAFEGSGVRANVKALLEVYNRRVGAVETDKSLLVDIPPNLSA